MMAAPQLLLRKPNGTAAGQTTNDAQNAPKTKHQPEGEKVVVRRLPPLLTEEEFFKILGDEWKMGHGKVDWFSYWPGKSSHHPSKPSRPSRAYFHVIKKDDLLVLSQAVQNGVWEDAKESYNDPVLILPPTVELSIHKKIPSDKKRLDNRQGTIDQEPEFMAFLESIANPDAHKNTDSSGEPNAEETSAKPEKITTTPLVEYLKEKKAQRAKEAALARSAKQHARQESQGGKTKTATATITLEELKKRAREAKGEKTDKVSQKLRDNVKILTKRGASSAAADAAKAANTIASQIQENARSSSKADTQTKAAQSSSQSITQSTPSGDATPEIPKSRRAGIAAAARILQRDLGLSPGNAHRKARQEAAKAEADAKASAAASASANAAAAQEIASREKKERETAPAPSSAERSSTPANAADSSVAASPLTSARERESASGRTRGRRGRGGTTEEGTKSKGADGGRETKLAEVAAPQPPMKPTMILKKRDSTQAAPPSAPSAPSTPVVAQSPASSASQKPTTPKPSTEGKQRGGRGRGGEAKDNAQPSSNVVNTPSTPAPTGPTQAFIKHAHQTQGVTESALRDAMQAFGPINSIDIRKKGLAYVDFADPEALKKAIAASPVTIARASVTILERKSETDKKEGGGRDKEKETAAPESATAAASAPMEKEKPVPEKENVKEKEKEKAPEKDPAREKRDDERRRGRGRGRGRDGGGGDKDKEKGEKGEKSENARGAAKGDVAKETVPQGGSGSDRPVSAPKAERGNAGSAAATRPTSAQDKGEKDNKENETGEKGDGDKNRRGRRRGGRGRGGGGDKDKERDKDGGGGGRGEKKTEGGSGSAQAAPAS